MRGTSQAQSLTILWTLRWLERGIFPKEREDSREGERVAGKARCHCMATLWWEWQS